jgi:YbbR domain-containing protein
VRITLKGESNSIDPILEEDIEAYVDLTKYRSEGVYKTSVLVRKKGTAMEADPLEIKVEPLEVAIGIEKRLSRTVPVVPSFRGYLEPGYELAAYLIDPPVAEIYGPRSIVEKYKDISTDPIELAGRKENFLTRVKLAKKDFLVGFAGSDTIEFRATVQTTIAIKTFENLPITLLELERGLAVEGSVPTGSLKVQGSSPDLSDWKPPENSLSADCSQIRKPGLHTLPVRVALPGDFLILKHEPESVTIRIVESPKSPDSLSPEGR